MIEDKHGQDKVDDEHERDGEIPKDGRPGMGREYIQESDGI
jgi:hypothetical protein